MKEVIMSLGEAKEMLPTEAFQQMMDRVTYCGKGWTHEVMLPTGAKCYARPVFIPHRGMSIEVKVSGYAWDGSDVDPYIPATPSHP